MNRPQTIVNDMFSGHAVSEDLFRMLCSDLLGSGISRHVYRVNSDLLGGVLKGCVFKFEMGDGFQNITEWQVWNEVAGSSHEPWFAPCVAISPCGQVLIQREVKELGIGSLPDKVPAHFTDLKRENWGMYRKHPVCFDYGYHRIFENGLTNRMRKARWAT